MAGASALGHFLSVHPHYPSSGSLRPRARISTHAYFLSYVEPDLPSCFPHPSSLRVSTCWSG